MNSKIADDGGDRISGISVKLAEFVNQLNMALAQSTLVGKSKAGEI
jgi:hypothetical protein